MKSHQFRSIFSDDSSMSNSLQEFLHLEQLVEEEETLMKEHEIPHFDDTLQEVEFILKMGTKLKSEGRLKFQTPPMKHLLSLETKQKSNSTSCTPTTSRKHLHHSMAAHQTSV